MAYDRTYVPQIVRGCRRTGMRHRLGRSHDASLEVYRADGLAWRLELLDISFGGVCFALEDGQPAVEQGARLERVVVQIAKTRIEGALRIAHATEEFAAGTICGAQFEPASEGDTAKLRQVIVSLGG